MRRLQLVDVADDAKTPVEHDPDEPFELRANSPLGVEAEQRLGGGDNTTASHRRGGKHHGKSPLGEGGGKHHGAKHVGGKASGKAGGFGAKQFGAVQHHGGKASGFGAKARDALAKHGGKGGGGKLRRSNLTAAALLGGVGGGRLPKMLLSSKQAAAPLSGHVDWGKASASHPVVMTDLEAPDVFRDAARAIATDHNEFLMMATGPDDTSVQMLRNALNSMATVGLRRHVMVLGDSWDTCSKFFRHEACYWSSRILLRKPSDSVVMTRFWDWRAPRNSDDSHRAILFVHSARNSLRFAGDSSSTTSRSCTSRRRSASASASSRSTRTPPGSTTRSPHCAPCTSRRSS